MAIIKVENLSKNFKTKQKEKGFIGSLKTFFKPKYNIIKAVKDISFEVDEGEIIAFIGPNGAGKSTSIKMMTGILYPDEGNISVYGLDPRKDRKRLAYNIGCVFGQKEQLWTHLTPYDNFRFFGAIYDLPKEKIEKKIEEFNEIFELKEFINTPVRNLSLGQRIRCEIVASLILAEAAFKVVIPTVLIAALSAVIVATSALLISAVPILILPIVDAAISFALIFPVIFAFPFTYKFSLGSAAVVAKLIATFLFPSVVEYHFSALVAILLSSKYSIPIRITRS